MTECYLSRWHISDYDGRRTGEQYVLNGMKLYKCKRLSEWIRGDEYLLRFRIVIWFLGGDWDEEIDTIFDIGSRLKELLGDRDIFEIAGQAEEYCNKLPNRMRWFLAAVHHAKKEVVDAKSEKELVKYFSGNESTRRANANP